jgi:hypothetical protein
MYFLATVTIVAEIAAIGDSYAAAAPRSEVAALPEYEYEYEFMRTEEAMPEPRGVPVASEKASSSTFASTADINALSVGQEEASSSLHTVPILQKESSSSPTLLRNAAPVVESSSGTMSSDAASAETNVRIGLDFDKTTQHVTVIQGCEAPEELSLPMKLPKEYLADGYKTTDYFHGDKHGRSVVHAFGRSYDVKRSVFECFTWMQPLF